MATLTEKQEAVKEILGSKASIRKFVQDEGIHLEDLENYSALILAVVLEEKEAKRNQIKLDAQKEQGRLISEDLKLRAKMAQAGFSIQEISDALGAPFSPESKKGKSKAESTKKAARAAAKKYQFIGFNENGDEVKVERSCQGHAPKELEAFMKGKGYVKLVDGVEKASLLKWVEMASLKPIED